MTIDIKYLGHSSFLLTVDKKKILTDPFFQDSTNCSLKRLVPCSHSVDKIPKIDTILISHEHRDSFDTEAINYLAKKYNPKIIGHDSVLKDIDSNQLNKITIDEYQKKTIKDITYKAYPAHHPRSFYPLSYEIVSKNKKSIYFAGDTFLTKHHEEIKPHIALLPIGGKRTMDLATAVRVTKKMRPKVMIPMHYNTFEDIKKNPNHIRYKLEGTSFNINPVVLSPGKSLKYKF